MTNSTNTPPHCWCGKQLKVFSTGYFWSCAHEDGTESCPDPAWLLQRNEELEKERNECARVARVQGIIAAMYRYESQEAQKSIRELEEENASFVSWQCPFQDGKTGLTSDEHGHQYCAKKARLDWLDEKRDKRVTIYSYSYIGGARDGEIDWCLKYREDTHAGWRIFTGETIREVIDKAMQADKERSE